MAFAFHERRRDTEGARSTDSPHIKSRVAEIPTVIVLEEQANTDSVSIQ